MKRASIVVARAPWSLVDGMSKRSSKCVTVAVPTNKECDSNAVACTDITSASFVTRSHHHHQLHDVGAIYKQYSFNQNNHRHHRRQRLPHLYHHSHIVSSSSSSSPLITLLRTRHQQQQKQQSLRQLSSSAPTPRSNGDVKTRNNINRSKSSTDDKTPLLNEHLIAELFNKMRGRVGKGEEISADRYQVRLIVDRGRLGKNDTDAENNNMRTSSRDRTNNNRKIEEEDIRDSINEEIDIDDDDRGVDENETEVELDDGNDASKSSSTIAVSSSSQSSEVTTLNRAISIAHEYELDLMEVTLQVHPPVIKAVNYDKFAYDQKRKQSKAVSSKKKRGGGGAISDRPVKEYKFRAGIADHDLNRKTRDMIQYLEDGHAIRVTLTARQRSLNEDAHAITTTLERVKELLGDKAVEARGMKANDRNSYGSLLFHPNTKK